MSFRLTRDQAAYVFFEKQRIAQNKPKSKHLQDMEGIWANGVQRDRDGNRQL